MTQHHRLLESRRVLVVEDEPLIAMAVEDELRLLGAAETAVAYNHGEALEAIQVFKPDLAILDVSLTENGEDYEIADMLADGGVPFVFSSGHLAGELPDRHLARPFVGKPMQSQDFIDAISTALTRSS